ncbi:MAG: hypothetical protein ACJ74Q_18015 [Pyrinomonadaceae bacterium]
MTQPVIDEYLVRKYLLGQLAEGEREWMEERLLTDDEFYETVTALEDKVEDELIDQYLDGELTGEGREHFERLLLYTPERADKLRLIKDLKAHSVPVEARAAAADASDSTAVARPPRLKRLGAFGLFRNPVFGLSCAAALLLALLCGVWLLVRSNRLEAELARARAYARPTPEENPDLKEQLEQLRARNEELTASLSRAQEERTRLEQQVSAEPPREGHAPAPPERAGQKPPRSFLATLVLSPTLRGLQVEEKNATLTLNHFAAPARLVLKVDNFAPGDYQRVRAVLRKLVGGEVWSSDSVKVVNKGRRSQVALTLPAGTLSEGQYTVDLEGITATGSAEPIGLYTFRVVTKENLQRALPVERR